MVRVPPVLVLLSVVAQRRGCAEGNARQIDMILRAKTCHGSAEGRGLIEHKRRIGVKSEVT
jgi:hypothetical protein